MHIWNKLKNKEIVKCIYQPDLHWWDHKKLLKYQQKNKDEFLEKRKWNYLYYISNSWYDFTTKNERNNYLYFNNKIIGYYREVWRQIVFTNIIWVTRQWNFNKACDIVIKKLNLNINYESWDCYHTPIVIRTIMLKNTKNYLIT